MTRAILAIFLLGALMIGYALYTFNWKNAESTMSILHHDELIRQIEEGTIPAPVAGQ